MSKRSLVTGAAVLGIAGVLVKLLGAVFRIPLARWIGEIGMANYSPAYYIYFFFLILATAGIPVAISRMVSERIAIGEYREAHRVFKISSSLMTGIGVVSFIILFIFADQIANLINVPESALAMRAVSFSLLVVPLMASYRGYFQGMQNMRPTALSQVIEQVFRVAVGLTLAYVFFNGIWSPSFMDGHDRYATSAAGAVFGAAAGGLAGLLIMILIYKLSRKKIGHNIKRSKNEVRESNSYILKQVLIIAIPITIGSAVMPITNLIDAGVVMNRLQAGAGFSYDTAKLLYGQLTGYVNSLINFPQVLTQAVAMSLVPVVAAAYKIRELKNMRDNINMGMRLTVMLAFPCAAGLIALAEPIIVMLYAPETAESAANSGIIMMIMAVGIVFLATIQTLTGVLQAVGKQMIPVRNLCIGIAVKFVVTWILVGTVAVNVKGAAIGTVTAYVIASILNIYAVKKYTGTQVEIKKTFFKPCIVSIVMGAIAFGIYELSMALLGSNTLSVLIAVCAGALIYGVLVLMTGIVTREELLTIPKGNLIVKVIDKVMRRREK